MLRKRRIPDDIIIGILSRLPMEALMRFKCVHKSWYVLIQDSKFVALHLRNHVYSRNSRSLQFLLLGAHDDSERNTISMLRYDGEVVSLIGKDVELTGISDMPHLCCRISCQCDGIVCFYGTNYPEPLIIANPGIMQFLTLPKSCIPLPRSFYEDRHSYGDGLDESYGLGEIVRLYAEIVADVVALGLGFDFRANDYKVIRILEIKTRSDWHANCYDVEVYTLSSNSWRRIEALSTELYTFFYGLLSSYWNGAYYWLASKLYLGSCRSGILSFNFSDEVFQFIPIPDVVFGVNNYYLCQCGILEFNGAQAFVSYGGWEFDMEFDIWDMDSSGVRGTWTKLLSSGSIKIDEHITCQPSIHGGQLYIAELLGVFENDELIILLSSGQVASYSFLTKQMKILPIDSEELYYNGVGYKSSLVSINTR